MEIERDNDYEVAVEQIKSRIELTRRAFQRVVWEQLLRESWKLLKSKRLPKIYRIRSTTTKMDWIWCRLRSWSFATIRSRFWLPKYSRASPTTTKFPCKIPTTQFLSRDRSRGKSLHSEHVQCCGRQSRSAIGEGSFDQYSQPWSKGRSLWRIHLHLCSGLRTRYSSYQWAADHKRGIQPGRGAQRGLLEVMLYALHSNLMIMSISVLFSNHWLKVRICLRPLEMMLYFTFKFNDNGDFGVWVNIIL